MNWMLTDMDSFFASVEQYLRPELRGRPVGIVPVRTDSTCIIAASYDAKRCGVKVGTGVRDARRLCPGITLVLARPSIYVQVHRRILQSVDQCAEVERVYSIDEWTIRLCGDRRQPEQAGKLARAIKRQIRADFGPWMTCSIGIAPTRLLAKIASDLQKPDGITLLPVDALPGRIEHLSLKDLSGISDGMLARLAQHGIHNIHQLWAMNREQAVRAWGSVSGARWWAGLHGHDEPEVPTRRSSMSHGCVLEPRFRTEEGARSILVRLICKLAHRLRQNGYLAQRLQVTVSDERGGYSSTEIDVPAAHDTPTLLAQFYTLWQRRVPSVYTIKKVDACVTGLMLASQASRPLFDEIAKLQRISQAMDEINDRWGSLAVYFGPVHNCRQSMENKIAFGRIPGEIE